MKYSEVQVDQKAKLRTAEFCTFNISNMNRSYFLWGLITVVSVAGNFMVLSCLIETNKNKKKARDFFSKLLVKFFKLVIIKTQDTEKEHKYPFSNFEKTK